MRQRIITRISQPLSSSSSSLAGYNLPRSLLELEKSTRMASSTMMVAHQQRYQHRYQQQQRWASSNSEEFSPPPLIPPSAPASTSTSPPSPFHHRPLHRNPSRIVSAIGSIYRPPDFFLGVDDTNNDNSDIDGREDDDGCGPFLFLPEDDTVVAESIGSCIKIEDDNEKNGMNNNNNDDQDQDQDYTRYNNNGLSTEMSICFLGTGAGSPACQRSTSGTVVKLAGTNYLFDAGEGIQRQFQFARGNNMRLQQIEKIFITHMHGDHIFGLPGLLLSLQTSYMQHITETKQKKKGNTQHNNNNNKEEEQQEQPTVKIYGPPGLFNYIASSIILSCSKLHTLNVEVYELMGGRVRKSTTPRSYGGTPPTTTKSYPSRYSSRQQQYPLPRITPQNIRDPFHDDYLEYHHSGGQMKRIQIPCEKGVWNIQDVKPVTREDIVIPPGGGTTGTDGGSGGGTSAAGAATFRSMSRNRHERIRIKAAEVDHLPGVATFGFVIEEDEPPYNLDVEKARSLGVTPTHKKYDLLKYGFPVVIADRINNNNSNRNKNDDDNGAGVGSDGGDGNCDERVVYPHEVVKSKTKKARKIAFIGDNRGWTREMFDIARNTDVLIHEATLVEEDYKRGHSTAATAGKNGANCDAKLLILNHISPKMEDILSRIVREAYNASGKQLSVLVSFDFMEVHVPWLGFGTTTVTRTTTATSEKDSTSSSSNSSSGDISIEPKDTETGTGIENDENTEKKTTTNRYNIIDWAQNIFVKSPK